MLTPLMQDHTRAGGLVRTDTDMAASDFEAPPPSVDEITTEVDSCDNTAAVNSSDEGMAGACMEMPECRATFGLLTDDARVADTTTEKNLQVDPTKNLQATPCARPLPAS